MRNRLNKLGKVKAGLHATQALFIFIAWALTIAVLTRDGGSGGQTWFFFILCFLTAPALVFQVMVPIYPRAQRFANVYAYAGVDIVFAILWFSASIAVAVWNSAGLSKGKEDNKDSDGSCSYFGYGDATKCSVSKASIGFGMLIFFLFVGTTTISILFCRNYRTTGVNPGIEGHNTSLRPEDPSKDVWSTNIEEREHDDYEEPDERHKYGQVSDDDGQGLLQEPTSYIMQDSSGPHPGAQLRYETPTDDVHNDEQHDEYVPKSALSPTNYNHEIAAAYQPPPPAQATESQHGRAEYPPARYDRI